MVHRSTSPLFSPRGTRCIRVYNVESVDEMGVGRSAQVLVLIAAVVSIASMFTLMDVALLPVGRGLKPIAVWVITYSYNPGEPLFNSLTPAIVNAVVWDFRGVDTFFETGVLFASVIGSITVYYKYFYEKPHVEPGLSLIVRTTVKLAMFIAFALALAIALKGHITPAGGFQGGAVASAIIYIMATAYSVYWLYTRGLTQARMLALRTAGLLGISSIALLPLALGALAGEGAYILQNQPKKGALVGLSYRVNGYRVSTTILLLNIFELLTVIAAFTLLLMILHIAGRRRVVGG